MKLLKYAIPLAVAVACLAAPVLASAEPYIPPGNPAASQYTEAFPTSGGNVRVGSSNGAGGGGSGESPRQALGAKTAKALESAGVEGEVVAALATEAAAPAGAGKHSSSGGGKGSKNRSGGAAGSGSSGSGGSGTEQGSSGLGEVASHATFSGSGGMGVFLPLVLLGALAWAVAYAWRRRRQAAPGA